MEKLSKRKKLAEHYKKLLKGWTYGVWNVNNLSIRQVITLGKRKFGDKNESKNNNRKN